jgi:hypothetical protein
VIVMDNNTNAVVPSSLATALTYRHAPSASSALQINVPGAFGVGVRATGQVSAQAGRIVLPIDATAFMKVWAPPPRRDPL